MPDKNISSPFKTKKQASSWETPPKEGEKETDLLIVGGGLSGVAAAVAAARRGVSVTVLERSHMLGGQATTAGVATADFPPYFQQEIFKYGLWGEISSRISFCCQTEYGLDTNIARYNEISFAPPVILYDRVLTEMLDEAGVDCYRNVNLISAQVGPDKAKVTYSGGSVLATLIMDATEEGEVLELSGADYRIGNSARIKGKFVGPALEHVELQDITQTAVIRRYHNANEIPSFARFDCPPPEYERFRSLASRAFPDGPAHTHTGYNAFAGYRATVDLASSEKQTALDFNSISRTSINYMNDCAISADYFFDLKKKSKYEREAYLRTLAIIYYLQVELGLPWAVASDEGFAESKKERQLDPDLEYLRPMLENFPLIPYVREARRGVGRSMITGKQIYRHVNREMAAWNTAVVGVGYYATDLHGGKREGSLETQLGEYRTDIPTRWREGPFPIPLASLLSSSHDRLLLAEKNISTTRIANAATRVHPTVVVIGEAAGTLAALALAAGTLPSKVPTTAVQTSLLEGGVLLSGLEIASLPKTDRNYVPIALAVCKQALDTRIGMALVEGEKQRAIIANRAVAYELGRALMRSVEEWLVPVSVTPNRR